MLICCVDLLLNKELCDVSYVSYVRFNFLLRGSLFVDEYDRFICATRGAPLVPLKQKNCLESPGYDGTSRMMRGTKLKAGFKEC